MTPDLADLIRAVTAILTGQKVVEVRPRNFANDIARGFTVQVKDADGRRP